MTGLGRPRRGASENGGLPGCGGCGRGRRTSGPLVPTNWGNTDRNVCATFSEVLGEGVERVGEDGCAVEGVEFFGGVDRLDGFAESGGDAFEAEFEGFEDGFVLGAELAAEESAEFAFFH